ncbi:MAG: hypothetical protein KME35_02880 [Aphanocapsa sp. GSE-SYN-MK-11-07L]|nr:hypothetical protein [Aphanocapsa sp. GSE-SYN-MK-11-07L]
MSFSGGYQSKVLKFVVQQSRQLSDRLQQQARQTKVATVWGLQVLLYPFYRLLQTTRSQPFRQAVANGWSQLQRLKGTPDTVDQPPADTPIQRVLAAIQCHWLAPAASSALAIESVTNPAIATVEIQPLRRLSLLAKARQNLSRLWQQVSHHLRSDLGSNLSLAVAEGSQLSAPTQIQGIATHLPNRHLVLVTTQNQVLDILTPQQQHQLQQWLIWEFAEYCRQLRRAYRLAGQTISLPQWGTANALPGRSPALSASAPKPALPAQKVRQLRPALPALPVWNALWQKVKAGVSQLDDRLALTALPPALKSPNLPQPQLPVVSLPGLASLFPPVTPAGAIQIKEAKPPIHPTAAAKSELTPRHSFAVAGAAGIEIEAEAFVIGYEKHFLERILEGLDRLMVGLEAIVAVLWQKLSTIEQIRRWQQWLSRFFSL